MRDSNYKCRSSIDLVLSVICVTIQYDLISCRKDKKLKENIISLTPPIIRPDHFPLRSVCPEQKKPHPQTTSPFVPPLRYAPKNIMAVMEQIRRGRKDISDAARENSCRGKMRANHIENTEKVPVFSLREEYSGSQCQRKYLDVRSFVAHQQMHSNERGRVLVDPNMGRANIGMQYGNCRTERRMSFAYGDQKLERSHSVRHYKDYSGDANRGGRSIGKGLKSAECYGDRERTNHCDEGVDLRDGIRMKRRLSAIQHGPCHQKRQGKQSRKLDFK